MKTKNKKYSKFKFIITEIGFTVENDHAIIKIKLPYQYSKIKNWKVGDKLTVKNKSI